MLTYIPDAIDIDIDIPGKGDNLHSAWDFYITLVMSLIRPVYCYSQLGCS